MTVSFDFSNRNYIVSGASSGIGRQICVDLARANACVLALARRQPLLQTLQEEFPENIAIEAVDVSDAQALSNSVEHFAEQHPIHGTVHAAGTLHLMPLRAQNTIRIQEMIQTHWLAGMELLRLATANKKKAQNSAHVWIASIAALKGQIGFTAYSAIKNAMIAGARCAALELATHHIRINTISPGWVQGTGMSDQVSAILGKQEDFSANMPPLGYGSPKDVSALTLFLLSDAANWITGANFVIDGGASIH